MSVNEINLTQREQWLKQVPMKASPSQGELNVSSIQAGLLAGTAFLTGMNLDSSNLTSKILVALTVSGIVGSVAYNYFNPQPKVLKSAMKKEVFLDQKNHKEPVKLQKKVGFNDDVEIHEMSRVNIEEPSINPVLKTEDPKVDESEKKWGLRSIACFLYDIGVVLLMPFHWIISCFFTKVENKERSEGIIDALKLIQKDEPKFSSLEEFLATNGKEGQFPVTLEKDYVSKERYLYPQGTVFRSEKSTDFKLPSNGLIRKTLGSTY